MAVVPRSNVSYTSQLNNVVFILDILRNVQVLPGHLNEMRGELPRKFISIHGDILMPIYEYECTGCHHTFDLLQKLNDAPVKTCPKCSKDQAVRLVSAAGFQLKGTGWYATDFKDKGKSLPKTETKPSTDVKRSTEKKTTEAPQAATSASSKGESD